MRLIRYGFLAVLAICLVSVAVANRGMVKLRLLSDDMAQLIGFQDSVELPLYAVIFGGVVAGVLIGFIWEWLREHKYRAQASAGLRETDRLKREVSHLRKKDEGIVDDVLALLESDAQTR